MEKITKIWHLVFYHRYEMLWSLYLEDDSDLPLYRGDQIATFVWMGDNNGFNATGPLCWFHMHNYSTSQDVQFFLTRTTSTIIGITAEWVMERPTFNGNIYDLTPFDSAMMYSPFARVSTPPYPTIYYLANTNIQVAMVDDASHNTLAEVTPIDENSMRFNWRGIHNKHYTIFSSICSL